jgi:hypothetical protein
MTNPITPPPELVLQWVKHLFDDPCDPVQAAFALTKLASQYGAAAALAQPEPQEPTDEELLFAYDEFDLADSGDTDVLVRGLRAVLARWGNR